MSIKKKGSGKGRFGRDDGYRVNRDIDAPVIRLIDEEGKMMGEMSAREAISIAEDKGLDLIEIAPQAKPPTCKIMDYGKWKYESKKKTVASKKKQTQMVIKEVQVRPRTEEHDLNTKLKQATKFLLAGDKVKVNLRFQGREMAHQDLGIELLNKITGMLEHVATLESPPKKEGRQMFILVAPDPVKIKAYQKAEKKKVEAPKDGAKEASSEASASSEG